MLTNACVRMPWIAVLAVLMAPEARAEGLGMHFALSGGAARGIGGPYTRDPSTSAAINGGAWLELSRTFSLGLEAGRAGTLSDLRYSGETRTVNGPVAYDSRSSYSGWRITPAVEWRGGSGVLRPRGSACVGFYQLDKREQSSSSSPNLNYDTTFHKATAGVGLAAGLDALFAGQRFGVGLELRWDAAFNDVDGTAEFETWWTLGAGVRF